jgi:hypothetical protein
MNRLRRANPRTASLRSRGKSTVECALRDIAKPIGASTYRITRQLPEPLRGEIPSIEILKLSFKN